MLIPDQNAIYVILILDLYAISVVLGTVKIRNSHRIPTTHDCIYIYHQKPMNSSTFDIINYRLQVIMMSTMIVTVILRYVAQ